MAKLAALRRKRKDPLHQRLQDEMGEAGWASG